MTVYKELQTKKDELERILKSTQNSIQKDNIDACLSKLKQILPTFKDKQVSLNENLNGGTKDINTHIILDNTTIYSDVYNNSEIQSTIDRADEIIRNAES